MKPAAAILIVAASLWLGGCVVGGKQQTARATPPAPAPAPPAQPAPQQPLSVPQTQVELPAPQPFDPAALNTEQPAETPAEPPSKTRPPRRTTSPPVRTAEPAVAATPPPVEAPEPERPPIQEILPAETQKKLQESAQAFKREVAQLLQQAQSRRLTRQQSGLVKRVEQFVKLSDGAEQSGNMREANEFAERALVLAKELNAR